MCVNIAVDLFLLQRGQVFGHCGHFMATVPILSFIYLLIYLFIYLFKRDIDTLLVAAATSKTT